MIRIRKSEDRGKGNFGWLNARYSFSFSNYYDPDHTGFRDLLVINQDCVEPDSGFAPHPHRDMEIITYIIDGEIEHVDSIGNRGVIKKGEIQRMSAGTGIRHSEMNPSKNNRTRLLQIWIKPEKEGVDPDYENVEFGQHKGAKLLVTPNGENNTARINQDFYLYGVNLDENQKETIDLGKGRHAWIQVVKGELTLNGEKLREGDGAAISDIEILELSAEKESELLVMNLK